MKLIRQPNKSKYCGQCCVAMATGTTVEQAKAACRRNGTTRTIHLVKGLNSLGARCASGRLKAIRGDLYKLPHIAILKVIINNRRGGWHWVIKHGETIFDPARGIPTPLEVFKNIPGYKISSYLEIFKLTGQLHKANQANKEYLKKHPQATHFLTAGGIIKQGFNSYAEADFARGGQVRVSHKVLKVVGRQVIENRIRKNLMVHKQEV